MEYTIKTTRNGYILSYFDAETGQYEQIVYEFSELEEGPEVHALQRLFNDIQSLVGMDGSRHDKHRLYVRVEPGDKYIDAAEQE